MTLGGTIATVMVKAVCVLCTTTDKGKVGDLGRYHSNHEGKSCGKS